MHPYWGQIGAKYCLDVLRFFVFSPEPLYFRSGNERKAKMAHTTIARGMNYYNLTATHSTELYARSSANQSDHIQVTGQEQSPKSSGEMARTVQHQAILLSKRFKLPCVKRESHKNRCKIATLTKTSATTEG